MPVTVCRILWITCTRDASNRVVSPTRYEAQILTTQYLLYEHQTSNTHQIYISPSAFPQRSHNQYQFQAMSEQAPTPRINAPYLENFTGQTVIITGKVTQLRGEVATIDANGEITVLLNRVCALPPVPLIMQGTSR